MNVLVTGARAPVALEIARRLADDGARVLVGDCQRFPLARFSRKIAKYVRYPSPANKTKAFQQCLADVTSIESLDLIVPTCEEIFFLAQCDRQVTEKVFGPPIELLEQLHHKWEFTRLLKRLNFNVPDSSLFESVDDLNSIEKPLDQLVLKPCYSRFATETLIRPKARSLSRISPSQIAPWIAQQFVDGKEFSTYSIVVNGQVNAHVTYHTPCRAGPGAGILFQPVQHETIRLQVEALVKELHLTGQIGFDVIEDSDGEIWFLEANPRATSGAHLLQNNERFLKSFQVLEGGPPIESTQNAKQVAIAVLLFALSKIRRPTTTLDWFNLASKAQDVLWSNSDPAPFFLGVLPTIELIMTAIWCRQTLQRASTSDFEWNGQRTSDSANNA